MEIVEKIYNDKNELVNTFKGKGALKSLLSYCFDKATCNVKSYKIKSNVKYINGESYAEITITHDNKYQYIWENVKVDSCGRIETSYINEILG